MIREGADNLISHFGNILNYSSTPIGIIGYKTLPGGLTLAKAFDPADANFQADMKRTFLIQVDPEKVPTMGMGGFSVGYKRLVVIEAPLGVQDHGVNNLPLVQRSCTRSCGFYNVCRLNSF